MKFLFLKTLLLHRNKDEGFTLPIVIAIGLVMLLLSTVNLIQSGEENLLAISKQGSSDALASAEFGIARYRELLNNNRVLAVYNLDQWTAADVEACEIITDTGGGWADDSSSNWRNVSLNETIFSVDFNNDGDQTDTNVDIGEYKIVNYIYDNDNNITTDNNRDINLVSDAINNDGSPPRGILTVKGRASDGSEAQIQVEIPLGVNTDDLNSLDPGLWVEQSGITNVGNVNVNGSNIVLYRPAGAGGCDDPSDLSAQNTISDPRLLPDIVDISAIANVRTLEGTINTETDPDPTAVGYPRNNYFNATDNRILLGTPLDNAGTTQALNTIGGVERYYYRTADNSFDKDLIIGAGENILADGTSKVILYVTGDLNITTGGNLIRLDNSSNAATSRYLEIHVNGNVNITGTGTVEITGLVHAPNGTINISGSANVNVTGSIWANNWNNQSSGNVTINTDDYRFYSITPNRTPKPLTYRPSNWETQEVQ